VAWPPRVLMAVIAARPRDGIITKYLLKQIRQSAGLSQEGLADQVGVDSNTVQGWETGRRSLTGTEWS
jgi:DNA-binding transcriptional regulator YiaG